MKNYGLGMLLMLISLMVIGCSGNSEPVSPGSTTADLTAAGLPLLVSDFDPDGKPAGGLGTLGVYSVQVDTNTLNYEMTPLRMNSSKDSLEVLDVTLFLNGWPCRDCASVKQVGITAWGDMNVLFGLQHPFPAPKFSEPISWANRADLHLFNVEGLLVFDDNAKNFPGINKKISDPIRLTNADGYDGYLDASIDAEIMSTDATLHPYRCFFVNYGEGNFNPSSQYGFTSLVNPSGYMIMKQASPIDQRQYYIKFNPGEKLNFLFVVQASYGLSSEARAQRLTPVYHCPQFNKKAASWIGIEIVRNDLKSGQSTSSADLKIKVLDINQNATVGTGLNQMRALSKVSKIEFELPGILTSKITMNNPVANGGDPRSETNPMYYNLTITNQTSAAAGDYMGLVKVLDNYQPGQNTNPNITDKDGGARVRIGINPAENFITIPEFATYQAFSINVATTFVNQPPDAVFHTIPRSDCGFLPRDITVTIDATDSTDPDHGLGPCGDIVTYEFDFEWNGNPVDFSADTTNPTGTADHVYTVSGPTVIGVRVTDGCTPPLNDLASFAVTIGDPDVFRSVQTMASFDMTDPTLTGQSIFNTTPMVVSGSDVYIAWTAYSNGLNYVYCARSGDGGCTWGPAQKIYHHADCTLATIVFVAMDKLANGDPILIVISPRTVICNYQAWWFHGQNFGENEVKWGFADAADLYGANSKFIDMVGHPSDPEKAYIVQWRTDLTPPQLMLIEVNNCMGPGDPTFPHMEVNLGPSFVIKDLDMVLDQDADLHVVWQTSTQLKYFQIKPSRPPVVSPMVIVSQPSDTAPSKPRIDVDQNGNPYIVYQDNHSGNNDIYLQIGTGSPVTFPNPSMLINQLTTNEQTNPDIRFNTFTRDLWVVYNSRAYANNRDQVAFERFDSTLNRITPVDNVVNTDDRFNTHDDIDPSVVCLPQQNAMLVTFIEWDDSPLRPNIAFNRTN